MRFGITNPDGTTMATYPVDLRAKYPSVGFPPDSDLGPEVLDERMIADHVVTVQTVPNPGAPTGYVSTPGAPRLIDGAWRETWDVIPAPMPVSVTRRQARLAMLSVGKLDQAESYINGIPDDVTRRRVQIEYEANTFDLRNGLIVQVAQALGWTDAELDEVVRIASKIPD